MHKYFCDIIKSALKLAEIAKDIFIHFVFTSFVLIVLISPILYLILNYCEKIDDYALWVYLENHSNIFWIFSLIIACCALLSPEAGK